MLIGLQNTVSEQCPGMGALHFDHFPDGPSRAFGISFFIKLDAFFEVDKVFFQAFGSN